MDFKNLISSGLVMKDEAITIDEFGEERYWPVGNVKLSYVGLPTEPTISYFSYNGEKLQVIFESNSDGDATLSVEDEFSLYVYKFDGVV